MTDGTFARLATIGLFYYGVIEALNFEVPPKVELYYDDGKNLSVVLLSLLFIVARNFSSKLECC